MRNDLAEKSGSRPSAPAFPENGRQRPGSLQLERFQGTHNADPKSRRGGIRIGVANGASGSVSESGGCQYAAVRWLVCLEQCVDSHEERGTVSPETRGHISNQSPLCRGHFTKLDEKRSAPGLIHLSHTTGDDPGRRNKKAVRRLTAEGADPKCDHDGQGSRLATQPRHDHPAVLHSESSPDHSPAPGHLRIGGSAATCFAPRPPFGHPPLGERGTYGTGSRTLNSRSVPSLGAFGSEERQDRASHRPFTSIPLLAYPGQSRGRLPRSTVSA